MFEKVVRTEAKRTDADLALITPLIIFQLRPNKRMKRSNGCVQRAQDTLQFHKKSGTFRCNTVVR
jgi:hypothetical protein